MDHPNLARAELGHAAKSADEACQLQHGHGPGRERGPCDDAQELGWGVGRNVLIDTRWSEDNADRSGNRVSTWPRETGHQRRGARPCQPKLISAIAVIVSISAITRFTSWASLAGRAGAQPQASDAGDARGG